MTPVFGQHWCVRRLFGVMQSTGVGVYALSARAGLAQGTISRWRQASPRIHNLEAAFNSLGWEIKIEPKPETEPAIDFAALRRLRKLHYGPWRRTI